MLCPAEFERENGRPKIQIHAVFVGHHRAALQDEIGKIFLWSLSPKIDGSARASATSLQIQIRNIERRRENIRKKTVVCDLSRSYAHTWLKRLIATARHCTSHVLWS